MNKTKKRKIYFGKETEQAVKEFLDTETTSGRHQIFTQRLHKPLSKLVENIVFTYRFINLEEGPEDLQLECLSHVYLNLTKFKPEKGRAYSYFGTMIKNYLIQKSIKLSKKRDVHIIDEMSENWVEQLGLISTESGNETDAFNDELIEILIKKFDKYLLRINNRNEKKVVQAVLYLLEHRHEVDLFNKKQLYVLLREITGLPTKKITQALNRLKQQYFSVRTQFMETGA